MKEVLKVALVVVTVREVVVQTQACCHPPCIPCRLPESSACADVVAKLSVALEPLHMW